jgi:hypothetical protein
MEASSRSIQEALRLGKSRDIFYYDSNTLTKQAIHTIVDNRFFQQLNSLGAGSSTFIISVDQGISDIILGAKLPEQGVDGTDYAGLALPRGYLYSLINRVSVRYAGSSQYFWTGKQMLIENLREMPNPTTKDKLFQLGGAALTDILDFAGDNLFSYAYINLPHNSPNGGMGKPNPLPSELLGQPIVVTLEMNPLPSIFSSRVAVPAGDLSGAPQSLESAYFQVKQIHAKDAGELMTLPGGRAQAYSLPLKAFYQNEVTIQVGSGTGSTTPTTHSLNLTGFRSGEVRSIVMWVTKDSDTNPATNAPFVKNFTNYVLPTDIEVKYNGTVFYRTLDIGSQMWNLCSSDVPSQLDCTVLSIAGGGGSFITTGRVANWVEIGFSQVFEQLSGSHMYVAGKLIQNAVVNMDLTLPSADAFTVHLMYSYNCALMISDRTAEYVF